jgi:hypothetical protein
MSNWLKKRDKHRNYPQSIKTFRKSFITLDGTVLALAHPTIGHFLAAARLRCVVRQTLEVDDTMKWITRERPKIDRVACPWLIARFIDQAPQFVFVPADQVVPQANATGAIPYDVPGVELTHDGPLCSFDALLKKYDLSDPVLHDLAVIVRGADTARPDLAPQCAGLLAISLGLSHNFADDHEQLRHGFVIYDALYSWLKHVRDEKHDWNPQIKVPS